MINSVLENEQVPTKFEIGGKLWTVTYPERCESNVLGETYYANLSIECAKRINRDTDIPYDSVVNTFFHELAHAILGSACYDEESGNEQLVQCIADGIHQFIKTSQWSDFKNP